MRLSHLALALGLTTLVAGCGTASPYMAAQPGVQALTAPADPFAEIHKVAESIWTEMEHGGYDGQLQVVSGRANAKPKYAFLNMAKDAQDPSVTLYRAGTYALTNPKVNVTVAFAVSAADRQNTPTIAEAARAIKAEIQTRYGHPATTVVVSPKPAGGPKYAFIAISANQPDSQGGNKATVWNYYYAGTYSVGTKAVDAAINIGIGHGEGYRIER